MINVIAFSLPAARQFEAGVAIPNDWDASFQFDEERCLTTVTDNDIAYVFRWDEVSTSPCIVVRLEGGKLFDGLKAGPPRIEALSRAIHAGISSLEGTGELPHTWKPFSGTFLTFQATSVSKDERRRLALWRRTQPKENACAFIFDLTASQKDYNALKPDFGLLERVVEGRQRALSKIPTSAPDLTAPTTMNLDDLRRSDKGDAVIEGWKYSYLYESKLTKRQREFVDSDFDRPIRLKGAAGTGKTLALVTKLLREASLRAHRHERYRLLMITHNASAAELALKYAHGLDENDLVDLRTEDNLIEIDTLLGLAIRALSEELRDLEPISPDAHEGKQLQLFMLSQVIASYQSGAWITRRASASESLRELLDAEIGTEKHEELCWDLMNEIATALDGEGVRDNWEKRQSYIKERRRLRSLMNLESLVDREVVLDIYDSYRTQLRREGLISVDQLIADYLGYLDSFRWDARRSRLGYDAIFVDEFHLFSSLERAAFPALMRDSQKPFPTILIALDPRQSPRAMYFDSKWAQGSSTAAPLAHGQAKFLHEIELNDVFRYTPEISNFLRFINESFPEGDISEEWLPGAAQSVRTSGELPEACEEPNRQALYEQAVALAESLMRKGDRVKVAILTLNTRAFDEISNAGRFKGKLYTIDSRESLNRLKYAGRRVVFSMPEYVAGVQFDHVIITDVNERDDFGRQSSIARSRFGALLYLGASRARQSISIFADRNLGGLATVIRRAVDSGLALERPSL